MARSSALNPLRARRIIVEAHTDELPVVLSKETVYNIEHKIPVLFKTAVLYCRKLGYSPEETEDLILKRKVIPIKETIESL